MDSVTIMLLPDQAYTKYRPLTQDHHLTVAYYGRASDHTQASLARLHATVNLIKAQQAGPISAHANGIGMFNAGSDGYAIVDLIDGIGPFHCRRICEEYNGLDGATIDYTHGFCPHITREYLPRNPDTGQSPRISADGIYGKHFFFTHVALWYGDNRYAVSL